MKAAIAEMEPYRRIVGPATRQRARSTLRAALNAAIAQQLITFNPAAHVELEAGKRPKASCGPRSASFTGSAPARSPRP
jgi:hypothetical protein